MTLGVISRIIPAYAGSTAGTWCLCRPISDHPRIRGEHALRRTSRIGLVGSSPHTRGARSGAPRGRGRRRIIPAYAGSTHQNRCRVARERGSSPHTRGAPARRSPGLRARRIIPAYAGSTFSLGAFLPCCTDHPRIRGEHAAPGSLVVDVGGSSPHTRGARSRSPARADQCRIIPAYAGSTPSLSSAHRPWSDHPRIRGEHTPTVRAAHVFWGSSPHTRGAPPLLDPRSAWVRIIPAYAGSTMPAPSSPSSERDHPRIRGEHMLAMARFKWEGGSSPHTRGARAHRGPQVPANGIIPAYAGSTPIR